MLPIKFRFIWTSSFRGDHFLEIDQLETRIACGGHVCIRIGTSDAKREGDSMMRWLQLMRNYFGAFASSQVGVFQMSIQVFSLPCQRQCELLPSLGIRRLSFVNFLHFNLLL
jgi:hypothetical protein